MSQPAHCLVAVLLFAVRSALADHFDDQTPADVAKVGSNKAATKVMAIAVRDLARLPHPLQGASSSTFLIVKTNEGNWCKLLVRPAQRRRPGADAPQTFLLIERLVTTPANPRQRTLAHEHEVYLFDGFGIDMDLGKIVPAASGEDLQFVNDKDGGKLIAAKNVEVYILAAAVSPPQAKTGNAKFGQAAIKPADFEGKYRLAADGRWSGALVLKVATTGEVSGEYRSDQTGQTYVVSGKAGNPSNRIAFKISFPMAEQTFDGYLWTRNRSKITGVTSMLDRSFGFQADRID